MRVLSRAQYLTEPVGSMRGTDFDTQLLVKAVKGVALPPNQYTNVLIGGVWVRITDANKDRAIKWFADWAAEQIATQTNQRVVLVPIPSHATLVGSNESFRTQQIAEAISENLSLESAVAPFLRFRKKATPSSAGGTRDPKIIYPNLALTQNMPAGNIILIDDVFTTGGHLIAAAWRLGDSDRSTDVAVCCGRTAHVQLDDPYTVAPEELDTARTAA